MWTANATHQLDLWITTIPKEATLSSSFYPIMMKNYVDVIGHPNPLPHFASGFWHCKNRYRTQKELLDVAKGYYDRQIPVSVIVIDYFHWTTFGDWKFNSTCWPNIPQMMNELKSYGMKLMVSVWPHVAENSENFMTMNTTGLLTHDANGSVLPTTGLINNFYYYIPDQFNPATRQYIWNRIKENYYTYGIKIYWLDADEPQNTRPNLQWWYGRHDEEIAMVWAREHQRIQAWIGSHLRNVAVWSGDIDSSWEELLKQIKVAQNVALSGIYWWTTDIGGYRPVGLDDNEFQELILRWFQFGAFCPLFRLHGYRYPPLPDNECGSSGGHNEVWLFNYSRQIIDIIQLRESLRDYIEYHLNISNQNGTPILRPMFYDFNDDIECYKSEDQYMFGSNYLVAPVYTYRATSRSVYLPVIDKQNLIWQHYYTKQVYKGDSIDSINHQILQTKINYLQKQYDEAIVIGDFTRQLAAEHIIPNKLQMIESFQEQEQSQKDSQLEIQIPSTIDNQQSVEYKKSKTSIKSLIINEKSLDTNQINEQIHELLNNYDTILQKHIQNDQVELSRIQTDIDQIEIQTDKLSSAHVEQDQNEIIHQQMIDTIEDLHQLKNNSEKQIDIQLQILDRIDQLDNQFINHKTLENLRKHLHEEQQASLNLSSDTQIHSDTHIQIIFVPTHLSKSPPMTIVEEKQIKNILHQTCY
ncbi:unnamed protein product [Rotaria sp. Silwood1]|nr:unnamed protein product [Rotaria sp. Silwood1]